MCVSSRYTSIWVDEMSHYMEATPLVPEVEEESDDDLDGFVASDDEGVDDDGDAMSADYSAEIAKIFGYDRTR